MLYMFREWWVKLWNMHLGKWRKKRCRFIQFEAGLMSNLLLMRDLQVSFFKGHQFLFSEWYACRLNWMETCAVIKLSYLCLILFTACGTLVFAKCNFLFTFTTFDHCRVLFEGMKCLCQSWVLNPDLQHERLRSIPCITRELNLTDRLSDKWHEIE